MGRKSYCRKLSREDIHSNDYFVDRLGSAGHYWCILDRTRNWVHILVVCIYRQIVRKAIHNLVGIDVRRHRDRHTIVYSLGGNTYG